MKKNPVVRKLQDVIRVFGSVAFPEYQREPTVWDRRAKQRLIDSIIRDFDVASIYFYRHDDDSLDCIDGRQRLNAIMSFVGKNPDEEDNGFPFTQINDIYEDSDRPYDTLEGMTYAQITALDNAVSRRFLAQFDNYKLITVELTLSARPGEFNLQFTRLNLGQIINSGEKLHAMLGQMRKVCFEEGGIGLHSFLDATKIPTKRFAREQTAAQILAQIFSLESAQGDFTRTRHLDLQRFFKEKAELSHAETELVGRVKILLDLLAVAFAQPGVLKNRAMTVSTVLLAWRAKIATAAQATKLATFITEFVYRLHWQVRKAKDLELDLEYRYLIDFQRHLTQASVEKPAVKARAETLEEQFARWREHGAISGDHEYGLKTGGRSPSQDSREG